MPISISMIVVSSQLVVAVADRVPAFDISRSCRLDLAATAGLAVDSHQRPASVTKPARDGGWQANGRNTPLRARQRAFRRRASAARRATSV
jgi:hypothetical protein